MAKAGSKPRKKANGYKMPDPLPRGLIVQDISKHQWKLGQSIGKGGFGEIYDACEHSSGKSDKKYPYVIKIEPHTNGPLFVEMHFYMRCAKSADIEAFKLEKKLANLGMPEYVGSGSHEYNGEKYRFLVMKKFGIDLWKVFLDNKRHFSAETAFKLGIQILDVLEYIHSRGYIHADIKGSNVLMGTGKEENHQVYLVDFGLCCHYDKKYKPDPKKAHNGTIEYLSRDAHSGVQSRRGDLEILGYNLAHWLSGTLPWEKLTDVVSVQNSKETYMDDLPKFFKTCFKSATAPAALVNYFKYVTSLSFETDPDYTKLRKMLVSGLEAPGGSLKSQFQFKSKSTSPAKRRSTSRTPSPVKKLKTTPRKQQKKVTAASANGDEPTTTPKKRGRQPKSASSAQKKDNSETVPDTPSYTAEMLRIKNKIEAKKTAKPARKRKNVNYNEDSNNSDGQNNSITVVSDSEEEKGKKKRGRRLVK